MKLLQLLISALAIATCAIAEDATKQGETAHGDAFLDFFESVLTVYVREKFLKDKVVLEYAAEVEEMLQNAEIPYNKITENDNTSLSIMPSLEKLNASIKGETSEGEQAKQNDEEAAKIMALFENEEWVLAMVGRKKVGIGKHAKADEKNDVKKRIMEQRNVKKKLAAQNAKKKSVNDEL